MAKLTKQRKIFRWYSFLPALAMFFLFIYIPLNSFFPVVIYIYLFGIAIYITGLMISMVQVYQSFRTYKILLILLLLPLQHLSYGLGFVRGLIGIEAKY